MSARPPIACLGAGRMARGIAVAFAYAGHRVTIIDVKSRDDVGYSRAAAAANIEVRTTLATLAELGLFAPTAVDVIAARVSIVREPHAASALATSAVVFEAVPEVLELKREILARTSARTAHKSIITSTTSTILVDDLSTVVARPERFLNAHWLNPAFIMPLVEVSPGARTDATVVVCLKHLLESIGKVAIVCAARPGYIVPRLQVLAMNEAARMVEEGVASVEDIDKAIKYGFGFRYANLGMLEFIDYGGGDILYYASRYLSQALGDQRYAAPDIVERNMRDGSIGLKTGKGFLDYRGLDVEAYRIDRLRALIGMLGYMGLSRPPVLPE